MFARRLRAGNWVQVRTEREIFATLDEHCRLDGLPFMPEMLQFCGKRFRVHKSAHKACDTIRSSENRWMADAVLLDGLRCDGSGHGGCQAACRLFWKTAWLKPVLHEAIDSEPLPRNQLEISDSIQESQLRALTKNTYAPMLEAGNAVTRYSCQATQLLDATNPLDWWDPRQYALDLMLGNISIRDFVYYVAIAMRNAATRLLTGDRTYPYVPGPVKGITPTEVLNLRPGERVQVRSRDEIMATLDANRKNRGLYFDVEMEPHCGKTYRVLGRVSRLIREKSGEMINVSRDCVILDGIACSGCLSQNRLFCPRGVYPYWREIWLTRLEE